MKIYVSGPMTGIDEFNYPAFHAAKEKLEAVGHEVLSPADLPIIEGWEWIDYMELDLEEVFRAEGFGYLPGWENSKGARIERKIAELRGVPIKPWEEWLET